MSQNALTLGFGVDSYCLTNGFYGDIDLPAFVDFGEDFNAVDDGNFLLAYVGFF